MTDATSSATPESAAPQPLSSAPTQTPSATSANPAGTAPDGKAAEPEPTDELVTTRHTVTLSDGQVLDYSATTGRLVLREEVYEDGVFGGHPAKAQVSITSYVREGLSGRERAARPVTFAFNGGPGSSSVWLHMGGLGPRRVDMGPEGFDDTPPFMSGAVATTR